MSHIHALAEALGQERFRHMSGTDRGIIKAIAQRDRDDLTLDDYQWAADIISRTLADEWALIDEGREADSALEERAQGYARTCTHAELTRRYEQTTGAPYNAREFTGTGSRRSGAAVTNETHRHSWEHGRVYARAIEILAVRDGAIWHGDARMKA